MLQLQNMEEEKGKVTTQQLSLVSTLAFVRRNRSPLEILYIRTSQRITTDKQ